MKKRVLTVVLTCGAWLGLLGAPSPAQAQCEGDLDADGRIGLPDLAILLAHFGEPCVPDSVDPAPDETHVPGGMVLVRAGEFQMGDSFGGGWPRETPVHTVYLDAYLIDVYEVTSQQYADALNWAWSVGGQIEVTAGGVVRKAGATEPYCDTTTSSVYSWIEWNGSVFSVTAGAEDHPMISVSWYGAAAYCNWRSAMDDRPLCYDLSSWICDFGVAGFRLPTEAEWEKAAGWDPDLSRPFRYGAHTDSLGGPDANYTGSGDPFSTGLVQTTPVGYYDGTDHGGTYQTNDAKCYYGCRDISGNVGEWCYDWYDPMYYSISPYLNPTGPGSGFLRVVRGGTWDNSTSYCRSAFRGDEGPASRQGYYGFRCAAGTR